MSRRPNLQSPSFNYTYRSASNQSVNTQSGIGASIRPNLQLPSFNCTYGSASNQSADAQYGIGASIGLAFEEIAKAKKNWTEARDSALASGKHWDLPNGTHYNGSTKIIKSDSCIRYEPETGFCEGVTKDGVPYSYLRGSKL
jgi:hypothetical protein